MTRKLSIAGAMLWTLVVSSARAARLPNNFAIEHWFIDYRFGFVKRGLVGALVSAAARFAHVRETEHLIDVLAAVQFAVFCLVLVCLGLHVARRSGWSTTVTLAVLVFLSSPFIVMSAHLIGYYDNIIIVVAVLSLALLFRGWLWPAAGLQAIAILVHENSLLVGFPVFCCSWWLVRTRRGLSAERQMPWPLLLPIAAFGMLIVGQRLAPPDLEQLLTAHLSGYPFIARTVGDVRVPHWITITFYDSYRLHQGHFLERILYQPMIGLVLPSIAALIGSVFDANEIGPLSIESIMVVGVCLAPQIMHVMAWDTARIWTYSILCAFLWLWAYVEVSPNRATASPFVRLLCIVALFLNVIEVTPLMDGLRDHFEVATRLLLYAPVLAVASGLTWIDRPARYRRRGSIAATKSDGSTKSLSPHAGVLPPPGPASPMIL